MIKNLKNKKKKKAFTLIELIIVIAIRAILAAIALPKFGEIRTNANIKADIATAKNIHSAVTAAVQETGKITDSAAAITAAVGSVPKSKYDSEKSFVVKLNNDKDVIVYVGEVSTATQVYPQPTSTNTWYK